MYIYIYIYGGKLLLKLRNLSLFSLYNFRPRLENLVFKLKCMECLLYTSLEKLKPIQTAITNAILSLVYAV